MKEFIDKLIARLEEMEVQSYAKMDGGVEYQAYRNAIQVVIELAEEYINTSTEHINCSTDNQKLECRCKDCIHWFDKVAGATEHVKLCAISGYMVGKNGYCVYGEKRLPAPYTEGE